MFKMKQKMASVLLAALTALVCTVMAFVALFVPVQTTAFAAETAWTLVTDASTLEAGDQVVIVASEYDYALSTTQNGNNRGQASVTQGDGVVTFGDDVQILTLEAGTVDGTFAFNTGSGYLYAASPSKNYLRTETTLSDNSSWIITIATDGVATIVAQGSNTRNTMQYNLNNENPIFSCYSSASQKAISLYKLTEVGDGGDVCEHLNKTPGATTPATCTSEGTQEYTCNDCEKTLTETIPALGHTDDQNYSYESNLDKTHAKYSTCSVCNADISINESCSFDEGIVTDPTEAEQGYTTYTCKECGYSYDGDFVPVVGAETYTYTLTFDADKANRTSFSTSQQVWEQNGITFTNNKASSSTNVADYGAPVRLYKSSQIIIECAGMMQIDFTCSSSSYAADLQESIGSDAAVEDKIVTVQFSETKDSYTITLTAQVRMDSLTVTVVGSDSGDCAHTNTDTQTQDATCTENGSTTITCIDCDTLISSENIPAKGHTTTEEVTQAATCTQVGSKTISCSACDYSETVEIPAVAHNYVDGVCSVCHGEQPSSCTLTFDNVANRISYSTSQQVWSQNGITFTNNKTSGSSNIIEDVNPVRLYAKSEIIIEYAGMTQIDFTCNSASYATALQTSIGANATVDGKVVTVVFAEAVDSYTITLTAQVRLDSLTVHIAREVSGGEVENNATIDSASVTLGANLIMNYYVTMDAEHVTSKMRFTFDNEEFIIEGEYDETKGKYKFSLPNLAPQCMTLNIKAELLSANGELLDEIAEYSIKTNIQNLLNDNPSDELKQLLTDMLYYGAAAQKYRNVDVGHLATTDVNNIGTPSSEVPGSTDFTLVKNPEIQSYPAYFESAGVWFDNVNKLFVKLSTTENVTLTINGVEVEVNDVYVYTDGILATGFNETYTFELYHDDGTGKKLMQTLTYSVNAYAYAMHDDAEMGELAIALYRYGLSAAAYNS